MIIDHWVEVGVGLELFPCLDLCTVEHAVWAAGYSGLLCNGLSLCVYLFHGVVH